ncbi:MAG: hypothetical protein II922_03590 [Succinimonas sp.]|nr:hypothetical protein [Succinimonas sp.]
MSLHRGAFGDDGYCWWWLRTPGINQGLASCVNAGGVLHPCGYRVYYLDGAVRPALRLILNN